MDRSRSQMVPYSLFHRAAGRLQLRTILWLLALGLILSACQTGAAPTAVSTPSPTVSAPQPQTLTAAPSPTTTAFPTAAPSSTPIPSPAPTLPTAQPVVRGPYLQLVQPDSIWVVWDTKTPSTGWLEYGITPALGGLALESGLNLHHAVQISGLEAGSTYYYRVAGDGATSTFRTAPADETGAFRFAVVGDTQSSSEPQAQIAARLVEAHPDFLLHLGDLVADGREPAFWNQFFTIQAPLLRSVPIYPTIGNHEEDAQLYFDIFHLPDNERWYAFDYGSARFLVLEVDDYISASLQPGGEQRIWLEQQLAGDMPAWLFVTFHIPVHGSLTEDPSEVNLRAQLAPLFEAAGVTAVFSGNSHQYERIVENGVTYIVSGGGGAPLHAFSAPEPGSLKRAIEHHFVQIDITSSRASGSVINIDGQTIDSFDWLPAP